MEVVHQLNKARQSLWYDNIQRRLLTSGEMAGRIARGEIRGVTSNPTIFMNAIANSTEYDAGLAPMAWSGWSAEEISYQLAVEDIRAAADLFAPLYGQTGGGDGYVSLEVSPYLANDSQKTLVEVLRLWKQVDRKNLMIKIPATQAGLPAITAAIAEGINVNVTLIFSLERYQQVMDAYLSGLEQRAAKGLPLESIASVASFFVSRLDSKVDARLQEMVKRKGPQAGQATGLLGKAAIANTRLAYADFLQVFGSRRFQDLKTRGARVQRPLWASTSTKNPAYRDVMYIEELIGPDTVNTVPPQTLAAFLDHGKVRLSLRENLEQARAHLAALESLGIHMKDVTRQLEEEGVRAFADAFTALLQVIEERRQSALAELGPLKQGVASQVKHLTEIDMPRRLWGHDPSLWAANQDAQAAIRGRLGWLESPERSRALLPEIQRLVKDVQLAGYSRAVLLGMGGSSLAPEVFGMIFGSREMYGKPGLDLLVLDSTDPAQVRATARWSDVGATLYIVSSKSGATIEVNAFIDFFWSRARHKLGEKAGDHFIAITDPGTPLEKLARERKFRAVFLGDPTVGGQFSALTAFGLVPAALLGIDVQRLLAASAEMAAQCAASRPAVANPGLVFGAVLAEAARQGRDKLTFIADPELSALGAWLEQLIAESSGKQGTGIIPVDLEPPLPSKKYADDRLFIHLAFGEANASDPSAETKRAADLRKAGQPVVTLRVNDLYDLGAEFFRWEVATAAACAILGVNGFYQPDVQDSKDRTQQKVDEFLRTRSLVETDPIWEGPGGRVYGWDFPGLNGARTLADVIKAFTGLAREGDYIAINTFVPRSERMLNKLQSLRAHILKTTHRATTLGFGPRFLHSTGQLHKGGPSSGLFLQITRQPSTRLDIPAQELTFGTLERAQALGDLEALLARGRRAIRIHLVDAEIKDLIR